MFHPAYGSLPAIGIGKRIGFRVLHALAWGLMLLLYRYRSYGRENLPANGAVLLVCNHQSFFDPILAGIPCHTRPFHALARASLWNSRIMRPIYNLLNAIPVARGENDPKAVRLCIECLKAERTLMLFPEGTRTPDGHVKALKRGLVLIMRKAPTWVVPVAIEGAQNVWPRQAKQPRLRGRIAVRYGEAIHSDELLKQKPDELLEGLRHRIECMRQELAKSMT
jgi:1-acyl-sn-glycerol-3-phosphate acyltransferase